MLKVKLIRSEANTIEAKINNFLQEIGMTVGYKVSVQDIKYIHLGGPRDLDEALIIYNQVEVKPYEPKPNPNYHGPTGTPGMHGTPTKR